MEQRNVVLGQSDAALLEPPERRPSSVMFSLSDLFLAGIAAALAAAFLGGRYWRSRELRALSQAHERFRLLAEHASDMLSTHAADGSFLYVSPTLEELLGSSSQALRGHFPADFAHPDDVSIMLASAKQATETGRPVLATWRCRRHDGAYVWLETNGRAVRATKDPMAPRFVASSRDVTRRKSVENALRESERRFRATIETTNLVAVALDRDGRVTFCNDSLLLLTGFTREELMSAVWFERHADSNEWHAAFLAAMTGAPLPPRHESDVVCRDGGRRLIAWDGTLLHDPNGTVVGAVYLGADVTERRAEEKALKLLQAVTLAIGGAESLDEALGVTLRLLSESAGWPYAELWLPSATGEFVRSDTDYLAPDADAVRWREASASVRLEARAIEQRRPVWLSSSLAVPVVGGEGVVAVMVFVVRQRRAADERHMDIVSVVANHLGALILRKRTEEELRLEQQRFRHAFDYSGIGMALVGTDGRWLRVNAALCEIVGYTENELLAARFQDITHPEDLDADAPQLRQLLDGEVKSYQMEKRYVHSAGHSVWVNLTVSLVRDGIGLPLYLIAQIEDVSEAKRAEEALREARDAAESASRAKSAFLARMSHELRTPLNAVIGFAKLLQRNKAGTFGADDLKLLERIAANGHHLLELINDILDLSRIESGRVDVKLQQTSLQGLVREVIGQIEITATSKGLRLVAELPDAAVAIPADAVRFKQVLLNLIGNAVKFTERGAVTVTLHVDAQTRVPTHIDISDTGIGIPPNRLEAVFEPFEQADVSTTRKYGGTGLGLPISRALCEAMNMRLTAQSTPGTGSTFTVWFAAPAAAAA